MKSFDEMPKSIKKTIRYINQDVSYMQFQEIKKFLLEAIEKKEKAFCKDKTNY
ncbi:hypothetical protein MT476_20625 [Bacillus sp. H8-1]|nr:hypothetical protein MT476_20625 [Bacillus sp. H8-1]